MYFINNDMKYNYYTTKFSLNGEEAFSLRYRLYESTIVEKFIEVVETADDDVIQPIETNLELNATKETIVNKWLRMWQLAQELQKYEYFSGRINFDITKDPWSIDLLNHLHKFVEEFGLLCENKSMSFADKHRLLLLCKEYNRLIHYFEGNNLNDSGWMGYRISAGSKKIPMTLDETLLGQGTYNKNKLYLGYGEIGKQLRHMFQNNDIDGLNRGDSNPKSKVSAEVFMPFQTMEFNYQEYEEWVQTHYNSQISHPLQYDDPRQWAVWEIGELVHPVPRIVLYSSVEFYFD